ncbi:MAG: hemagglutinin repeat-containing protein [Nitrospirota bacterium]
MTLLSFIAQPTIAAAQMAADPSAGAYMPHIETTANGLPLVQITDPSAAGVSRNQFTDFNVDPQGAILNNATSLSLTQQAGYVDANPYLTQGSARVILNEVTGTGASSLRGYTEVAGQQAEVVIANPNGITCDGCGFINASRGVLSTGTPLFGGTGSLDAFRVTGGNITITGDEQGGGLNAGNIDQVDLISRTVNVNSSLWANHLNVITGANQVNYADLAATPITGEGAQPQVSLDVAALGGMYANKIRLVGTEKGVGVVNNGVIASTGDFTLTNEGNIVLNGQTTAGGNLSIQSSGDISLLNSGDSSNPNILYSNGNMAISANGLLTNNSTVIADQLTINAAQLLNDGSSAVIATKNETGTANFFVTDSLTNKDGASLFSMGDIVIAGSAEKDTGGNYIRTGSILNQSATIEAGRDITVSADTITNKKRVFTTEEFLDPEQTETFMNVPIPIPEGLPVGIKFVYAGYIRATASYVENTTVTQVTADSPSGALLAGRDLTIQATDVNNEYSIIAAGNNLTIDATGVLNNTGRGGFNVTTGEGTQTLIYTYENRTCRPWGCYSNWPEDPYTYPYSSPEIVTQNVFLPGAATIAAGNQLTVNAGEINNVTQGPGDSTTSLGSIPNDTANIPDFTFTMPQGGLYKPAAPNQGYLVETNPLFTDLRNFMSSDYMLERLAYDPALTQKRLGDGFYEQKLVLDQVTQATGRRFLEDSSSAEGQFQALMDAGIAYAQAFDLKVGVGLTAEQMAQLTTDMVWLVEQEVLGQKVLAPVVYLSQLRQNDLRPSGALIAAQNIELRTSDDLFNSGTIMAGDRAAIMGADIINQGGRIDAGGLLTLASTNDIVNQSGTLSGGRIALDAGRDIRSETLTVTRDSGAFASTRAQSQATIDSSGDILAAAGRDLVLAGSGITAGGDAELYAGRDLTIGSVEENERVAVVFAGGGFYTRDETTILASSVQTGGNLTLTARQDATLAGAQVAAGADLDLLAGRNVTITAVKERSLLDVKGGGQDNYTRTRTDDETVVGSSLLAGGNIFIAALPSGDREAAQGYGNILLQGSIIASQFGDVTLLAENDVTVEEVLEHHESLTETKTTKKRTFSTKTVETRDYIEQNLVQGSFISGNSVTIASGKDINVRGSEVAAADSITLAADDNVTITAATETRHEEHERRELKTSGLNAAFSAALSLASGGATVVGAAQNELITKKSKSSSTLSVTDDEIAVGSSLEAGGSVIIVAGRQGVGAERRTGGDDGPAPGSITIEGSSIASQAGGVTLAAENDVTVKEARERHTSLTQNRTRTKGALTGKLNESRTVTEQDIAAGSTVSGDTVTIASGNDLTVQGSAVVGSGDVSLTAARNVAITTAGETLHEEQEQRKRRTGVSASFGKGGLGATYGTTKQKSTSEVDVVNNVGSAVGSVSGGVTITAGKDAAITGSEVLSATGTDITARNVAINSAYNTADTRSTFESKSYGLNLQVGNKVIENVGKAHEAEERSDQVQDSRLKALYAYRGGRALYDAYQNLDAATSVQVKVGVSTSKSKSESESHSTTAVGSRLITDGSLNITATGANGAGGDIAVIGSALEGKNISLDAARDITLQSAKNTMDSRSTSRSSSGGAGVSVGVSGKGQGGVAVYAEGSYSTGNTEAHSLTHTETQLTAQENLSIKSGRDTTLKGAQARAETITADVGRNLSLESEQDTETYRAENKSVSGSVSIPIGPGKGSGNLSYTQGKTESEFRSVIEQTGFFAGAGGFDITVGAHTELKGAVIASTAEADKNSLSTGTFSWSNIENKAEYSASTTSVSAGYDPSKPGIGGTGVSGVPIVGVSSSDSESSATLAAISPATIRIRSNPDQDLSELSRDPEAAHQALGKIFDQKKVEEQQEFARVFGEEAFRLVGDIAKMFTDPYKKAELTSTAADDYRKLKNKENPSEEDLKAIKDYEKQGLNMGNIDAVIAQARADMQKYQEQYDTWKEGSAIKTAMHALVGGLQAKYGGGNAFSGAVGAGAAELSRDMTRKLSDAEQQWASVIIGATAAKLTGGNSSEVMTGAATALDGEKYNRQLHQHEIDRAKKYAKQFQKWVKDKEGLDITEDEAEGRLMRQMLRWADYETAKTDGFREDRQVTSFMGKNSVQVTAEEYYNPYINMDVRLRNLDSYAHAQTQQSRGLTPQEWREKNLPHEILGKTAVVAAGGYVLWPALSAVGAEVTAFLQNPVGYCLANPFGCMGVTEAGIYTAAGVEASPASVVPNLGPVATEARAAATTLKTETAAAKQASSFADDFSSKIPWKYGDTGDALGLTDEFGNITIAHGLSGQELIETVTHEGVHRFFTPLGGPLQETRAEIGMWAYQNSHLARYLEEAIAETVGVGSLRYGLTFPLDGYGISKTRLTFEAFGYVGITGGMSYYAYQSLYGDRK